MFISTVSGRINLLQILKITNHIVSMHTRMVFMTALGRPATVEALITVPLKMKGSGGGRGLNFSYD